MVKLALGSKHKIAVAYQLTIIQTLVVVLMIPLYLRTIQAWAQAVLAIMIIE